MYANTYFIPTQRRCGGSCIFCHTRGLILDAEILSHILRCNVLWLEWHVLFNSLNDKVCANLISSWLPRYATAPPTEVNKAFYHIQQPVLKPATVYQMSIGRSIRVTWELTLFGLQCVSVVFVGASCFV